MEKMKKIIKKLKEGVQKYSADKPRPKTPKSNTQKPKPSKKK